MGAVLQGLGHWAPYAALRSVASLLHLFGVEQNLRTAATIGSLFAAAGPRRMRRAERHVRWAFPDWPEERVRHVAEASVQRIGLWMSGLWEEDVHAAA